MKVGTRFPPEWLLKKSREECKQLEEENSKLREENFELKLRIQQFTSAHEAKIAVRKEQLYQDLIKQNTKNQSRYTKARKALSDIKKIAFSVGESCDAVAYMDEICQILIKYYNETDRK